MYPSNVLAVGAVDRLEVVDGLGLARGVDREVGMKLNRT